MKLNEKIRELTQKYPEIDKVIILNTLGTFLNLLETGLFEIEDNEIKDKFQELQELVTEKRKLLSETEIKDEVE